jgi:hypothetical protein
MFGKKFFQKNQKKLLTMFFDDVILMMSAMTNAHFEALLVKGLATLPSTSD